MKLVDWLREKVTQDPRAMEWFSDAECEDRIVRAYRELLEGYRQDPSLILKETRPVDGEHHGVVTVRDINYYSICAHHFLPFFGKVSITYVPGTKIIGLGKFPRLVQAFSKRFQIQEDLVKDIAEEVMSSGHARGVHVTATGRHMCMCSRGPDDSDAITETTYALGTLQGRA
ncbi:MAG: GTP cyclohydrolase I [Bdellovibrionota bacterium]